MTNGGKDVRLGDDKRPVSIIPSNQQFLYNLKNGEILTDEFGVPLVTEVDEFFINDTTAKRSTSITFASETSSSYNKVVLEAVGVGTANYGVGREIDIENDISNISVLKVDASTVAVGSSVLLTSGSTVPLEEYPFVIVRANTLDASGAGDQGQDNVLYFDDSVGISTVIKVLPGDLVSGFGIAEGTRVSKVYRDRLVLTKNTEDFGSEVSKLVKIQRTEKRRNRADQIWKVAEVFKETSEVSQTLLGIPRAETQLSLFSDVSVYGLDDNIFEFFSFNGGTSPIEWLTRSNKIYGERYTARSQEEVQESAIRLEAFPTPFSFPYPPIFSKIGLYDATRYQQYINFIRLGNDLYNYYDSGAGSGAGYPADWKDQFLDPRFAYIGLGLDGNTTVLYGDSISESFTAIDTWTDTFRRITPVSFITDPVLNETFDLAKINQLNLPNEPGTGWLATDLRPGYSDRNKRYAFLQSRKVFRYQPGRISGFTFGLRSSVEPVPGVLLEWGIKNPTDQYVFQIEAGQLKIIRRSTVPLTGDMLTRSGLTQADQVKKATGDPFDGEEYWTTEITRDKFNGDPLTGNGPSGYLLQPEKVTMYKIEFGWYGAIGARFYAYIPVENGDARWVVIHTLVIENQLGQPCLQDSYFRFIYTLDVFNTAQITQPQFLYKYGASYYIDGGDEGTSQIFSVNSGEKTINAVNPSTLIGVTPKDNLLNNIGTEIPNKKIIIPTTLNVTSDSLSRLDVITCKACPGFGHVLTPGVASTVTGREIEVEFISTNTISAINDSFFSADDVGAKLIAPSLYNAYITEVSDPVGAAGSFETATVKGYGPGRVSTSYGDRPIGGEATLDRVTGVTTTIAIANSNTGVGGTYPHPIRLSNKSNHYFASDFKFTGSDIQINFVNPVSRDSYGKFADFEIGVTNKKPTDIAGETFDTFTSISGDTSTTITPDEMLTLDHSHTFASMNVRGVETGEAYPGNYRSRGDIDFRIPRLPSPAPGVCSKVNISVLSSISVNNVEQVAFQPQPDPNDQTVDVGTFYLLITGTFPSGIDYKLGQVKVVGNTPSNVRYAENPETFTTASGTLKSRIKLTGSLGTFNGAFGIELRPVRLEAQGSPLKQKLFNYNPFPLYLVGRLSDNAKINNISVKEVVGDKQKTISPKLYVKGENAEVTDANAQASKAGIPPTNFDSVSRLSSALVDVQNEQRLRQVGIATRDIIFIGENSTKEVDMSKTFGIDRNVITPDNQNIEATFFVGKKIDSGPSGTISLSLNYKEQ